MSEIKVNSIKGVAATTAALTINNTDGTATANLTNIGGGQLGNRNLIINGAFQCCQRVTSSTDNGYGSVDRFRITRSGTDESPTQEQADVAAGTTPYTLGFRKCYKITNGNQTSGAGAADFIKIQHRIEGQNIANSGWNYKSASSFLTLSFWVKSSVAQNFYGYLETHGNSPAYLYPYETGSLSQNTWTKVTKTIAGNSNLLFNNDNAEGLRIEIHPFLGTDSTASGVSLNQWNVYASASRTPDQTATWYETNDATFEITGVQLEVGSVGTDFEHRSFAQELDLCTRYCQVFTSAASDKRINFSNVFVHGNGGGIYIMVGLLPMRSAPSVSLSGSFNANVLTGSWTSVGLSNFTAEFTSNSDNYGKTFGFDGLMSADLASNQTVGKTGNVYSSSGFGQFIFSAEL